MSTATKRKNIFSILFGSGIDVEDYDDVTLPQELEDARKKLEVEEKRIEKGFNSNKGGIAPKINPDTEKAMRAMHSKVVNKGPRTPDKERE